MKEFLSSRFRSQWVYRTKYGTAYSPNLITLRKVPNQLNKNYLVNKSTYSGLSAAGTTINEPWVRHCSAAATGCVLAMMQSSRILISSLLLMSYVSIHLFESVLRSARRNDRPPDGTISSCLFYLVQNLLWYSRQKRTAVRVVELLVQLGHGLHRIFNKTLSAPMIPRAAKSYLPPLAARRARAARPAHFKLFFFLFLCFFCLIFYFSFCHFVYDFKNIHI